MINIDGCLDYLFLYLCLSLDCNCICIVDCRMQIAWAAGHTFAAPICKKNVSCKPTKEITHANVPYERIPQGKVAYINLQETICSETLQKGCEKNMPLQKIIHFLSERPFQSNVLASKSIFQPLRLIFQRGFGQVFCNYNSKINVQPRIDIIIHCTLYR